MANIGTQKEIYKTLYHLEIKSNKLGRTESYQQALGKKCHKHSKTHNFSVLKIYVFESRNFSLPPKNCQG